MNGFGPYFGHRKLDIAYSNDSASAETHLPPINGNASSTSLPGGNLVDGLPPAASMKIFLINYFLLSQKFRVHN